MPARQRGRIEKLPSGRWSVRFYDDAGTRRRQGGFDTKSEAGAWLDRKLDEVEALRRGDRPSPSEIPTVAEEGVPDLTVAIWYGLVAPAGTPPEAIARLNAEFNKAVADPDITASLIADGTEPLTPREREIASLAAQGLSSNEIAQRLFLSPRTVNNHLQSTYTKLGIRGRRELQL